MSVDCAIDKDLVLKQTEMESKTRRKEFKELLRQDMESKLVNWGMVVLASCAILVALSKLVVTPLVTMEMARRNNNNHECRRRQQQCRRRRSRSSSYRHHSGSCAMTATSRSNSTGSSGGSTDSLPMHHPSHEHLTLMAHAESMDDGRDGPNYVDDDDADYRSNGRSSSNTDDDDDDDDVSQGTSASDDFDAQVPADFDAIPIVAATIMPAVTLQAIVIQDGITYT